MINIMRNLRTVLGYSGSQFCYQSCLARKFQPGSTGTSNQLRFKNESPPETTKTFESEQLGFRKEYKRLLSQYETGDERTAFQHREKILHSSCESNLSQLLLHANGGNTMNDHKATPDRKNKDSYSYSYIKEYLQQHAMFIEMPGKMEMDSWDLDGVDMEALKTHLMNDKEFRFFLNKHTIKRKAKRKKVAKAVTCTEEAETLDSRPLERVIPYLNTQISYRKHLKWKLMSCAPVEFPLIFDMSFGRYMNRSSAVDLASQLFHALSYNEEQQHPLPIMFANFTPDSETYVRMCGLRDFPDYCYMDVSQKHLLELDGIDPEQLIYLTPNADQEMGWFEEDKAYIIGGLVDRGNAQDEHTTHTLARRIGINCQKLPLTKYLLWGNKTGRQSLTIDVIFRILHTMRSAQNWPEAFQHIPKRFYRGLTEIGMHEAGSNEILEHYKSIRVHPSIPALPTKSSDKYLGWSYKH